MANKRKRTTETILYTVLWVFAVGLYILDSLSHRAQMSQNLIDFGMVRGLVRAVLPLFVLFLINNYLLIPQLILKNRFKVYAVVISCLLIGLWCYQYYSFLTFEPPMHQIHGPMLPPDFKQHIPMPLIHKFTYGLLVVGVNVAITLMFQKYDDKLERESIQKMNAENQLANLKAQIHPHFYLNMLNNIHGMIDIDPEKAQEMLIDMSKLMRFMLYDSEKPKIYLTEEVAFLENYLELMHLRYPANRVTVNWIFPEKDNMVGIMLPPLLFISFIENAFKHGISFLSSSYISVKIDIVNDKIHFVCINSVSDNSVPNLNEPSGIGLKNITKRLKLIYGSQSDLTIKEERDKYIVSLTIPIHDNQNSNN